MTNSKSSAFLLAAFVCIAVSAADAGAQTRGRAPSRGSSGGGGSQGRAVPRSPGGGRPVGLGPRMISPRVVGGVPYRPYYYPYRPGLNIGLYAGYGYPYGYRYGYPYGYDYYGYPSGYPYSSYGYGSSYGYALPPAGYVTAAAGVAYGSVRIQGAPREAQVFADGYYVGIVDDFDGAFKHMSLQAGPHRIEIRLEGYAPITFDVNVQPGQTITYRAGNLP